MGELRGMSTPEVETFRQVVVLDIVWRRPVGAAAEIDWPGHLAQALNEANDWGALWDASSGPVERLVPERKGGAAS
jgi:hypothetical protein